MSNDNQVTVSASLLRNVIREMKELRDGNKCDHSVGLCWCEHDRIVKQLEEAVASNKEQLRDRNKQAVERLAHYWGTYNKQPGYENYSTETFLNDGLYGLGIAIDSRKYSFANGFAQFKRDLLKYLNGGTNYFKD